MKKLILIIILLLCPSLILAEEKTGSNIDEARLTAQDLNTSMGIAYDIFVDDIRKKYGHAFNLGAILLSIENKELAEKVLVDINTNNIVDFDLFSKYSRLYDYNISDNDMFTMVIASLNSMINFYKAGMNDVLILTFKRHKDIADSYKKDAPKLYKEYLFR
jgi:hypothetical protein